MPNQVLVTLRWARWLLALPGAQPLLINLDETGVPMYLGDVRGNVARTVSGDDSRGRDMT